MILACVLIWVSGVFFGIATAIAFPLPDERHQPPWDRKGEVEEAP